MRSFYEKIKPAVYTVFFLLLTFLILSHSQKSLYYTLNGLNLWFSKMIPSLLPFMILSGIMVRLHLTEGFASLLHPVIAPLFRVRKNVTYAMIMGFLCGFPMGARVTSDLLERNMITKREAEYLLAFCNNIGPVYFMSFVIPILQRRLLGPYLFGMYGLPLLYGLLLRYTAYRDLAENTCLCAGKPAYPAVGRSKSSGAFGAAGNGRSKLSKIRQSELSACEESRPLMLLEQIDDSIHSGIQSILMLGGYMILFNLLNLVPDVFCEALAARSGNVFWKKLPLLVAPVLEITGGIGMLKDSMPLFVLVLLPFGGLSCIAQTYSIIRYNDLSIQDYIKHKLALTGMTLAYYMLWKVLFPGTFLV